MLIDIPFYCQSDPSHCTYVTAGISNLPSLLSVIEPTILFSLLSGVDTSLVLGCRIAFASDIWMVPDCWSSFSSSGIGLRCQALSTQFWLVSSFSSLPLFSRVV